MRERAIDSFWAAGVGIGIGMTASLLVPARVALLCGFGAGITVGASVLRVRNIVEREREKTQTQLDRILEQLDPDYKTVENYLPPKIKTAKKDNVKLQIPLEIELEEPECDRAIAWLKDRNIEVKNYHKPAPDDRVFNYVALLLGRKYDLVKYLYLKIKRNHHENQSFSLNLSSHPPQEIGACTQFAKTLFERAFLKEYRYHRNNKTIYANTIKEGSIKRFFDGNWFERFIKLEIVEILATQAVQYQLLVNSQIVLATGEDFELDMLFLIEGEPLWIECKTGDYQTHIEKYSKFRGTLGISPDRALLVILDLKDELTDSLTSLYGLRVLNQNNLLSFISDSIADN
ncbi:MAG: hypothetical protein J7647_08730 [Cyanobacteria bacterium SBLK]|nr:hypothetical protein [Cyanobacteria bacterium SBLK]